MKKKNIAAIFLLAASVLCSCSKDDKDNFSGTYTYKLSGTVNLIPSALYGLDEATLAAYAAMGIDTGTRTIPLTPEQGQMNIVSTGKGTSEVLVTFNAIMGNACHAAASVSSDSIALTGTNTKTATLTDGTETIGAGIVSFTGVGTLYDKVLLLQLEYNGAFTVNGMEMTVTGSNVECVAKAN